MWLSNQFKSNPDFDHWIIWEGIIQPNWRFYLFAMVEKLEPCFEFVKTFGKRQDRCQLLIARSAHKSQCKKKETHLQLLKTIECERLSWNVE